MIFKTPLLVASAAIACIAVSGCASNSSDTASSKATDKVTSATPAKKTMLCLHRRIKRQQRLTLQIHEVNYAKWVVVQTRRLKQKHTVITLL